MIKAFINGYRTPCIVPDACTKSHIIPHINTLKRKNRIPLKNLSRHHTVTHREIFHRYRGYTVIHQLMIIILIRNLQSCRESIKLEHNFATHSLDSLRFRLLVHRLIHIGLHPIISIAMNNIISGSDKHSVPSCTALSSILFVPYDFRTPGPLRILLQKTLKNSNAIVRTTIINKHIFYVRHCLVKQRAHTSLYALLRIINRHNYRHLVHISILLTVTVPAYR